MVKRMPDHPDPKKSGSFEPVEFASQDAVLRGRLYRPPGDKAVPLVVMAHGTSATITMTADRYAEVFQAAGLAVLLYDHRNFGASGGEPRYEINPWIQARGYIDAMEFAGSVPGVDARAIALWGDSYSASEAIVAAAADDRAAAVIAQVPAIGRELPPPDPDGSLFRILCETLLRGEVGGEDDDVTGPLPVVSADQINSPSLLRPIQAYRWFIEYGGRHGSGWENRVTRVIPKTPAPFHAGIAAPHLRCPLQFVMSPTDEMPGSVPDVALAVFESVPGPKELVEVEGGHFGIVQYPGEPFDVASAAQKDFLLRMLL
jgi:hypothetical protein